MNSQNSQGLYAYVSFLFVFHDFPEIQYVLYFLRPYRCADGQLVCHRRISRHCEVTIVCGSVPSGSCCCCRIWPADDDATVIYAQMSEAELGTDKMRWTNRNPKKM